MANNFLKNIQGKTSHPTQSVHRRVNQLFLNVEQITKSKGTRGPCQNGCADIYKVFPEKRTRSVMCESVIY